MATTTNYSWTTPDDTSLVKDGAAAIRSLGTSIDTTTKALNPSTTLGDIEYRSSTANTNTRLGIGTTGQVLTVAGGVPSWASATAAGTNWSLLNAGGTALTGASTITVSGISGKDKIMVLIQNASSASASSTIGIRLNADSGTNYATYGFAEDRSSSYDPGDMQGWYDLGTSINIGRMSSTAASPVVGAATFTGCNSSGVKAFDSTGAARAQGGNSQAGYVLQGFYNSSSTISSVSVISGTGNFDAGTVFVYTSAA